MRWMIFLALPLFAGCEFEIESPERQPAPGINPMVNPDPVDRSGD